MAYLGVQFHLLVGVLLSLPLLALSSVGDRSVPFQNFLRTCLIANCSSDAKLAEFEVRQPQYMQVMIGGKLAESVQCSADMVVVHDYSILKLITTANDSRGICFVELRVARPLTFWYKIQFRPILQCGHRNQQPNRSTIPKMG